MPVVYGIELTSGSSKEFAYNFYKKMFITLRKIIKTYLGVGMGP